MEIEISLDGLNHCRKKERGGEGGGEREGEGRERGRGEGERGGGERGREGERGGGGGGGGERGEGKWWEVHALEGRKKEANKRQGKATHLHDCTLYIIPCP